MFKGSGLKFRTECETRCPRIVGFMTDDETRCPRVVGLN